MKGRSRALKTARLIQLKGTTRENLLEKHMKKQINKQSNKQTTRLNV